MTHLSLSIWYFRIQANIHDTNVCTNLSKTQVLTSFQRDQIMEKYI